MPKEIAVMAISKMDCYGIGAVPRYWKKGWKQFLGYLDQKGHFVMWPRGGSYEGLQQ